MQQWHALWDPAMEDALYEVELMRRFAGLDLNDDAISYEATILKFHHMLEKRALTGQMMNISNDTLEERGLLLEGGTLGNASIIHAFLRRGTGTSSATPRCIRPRRATSGTSA